MMKQETSREKYSNIIETLTVTTLKKYLEEVPLEFEDAKVIIQKNIIYTGYAVCFNKELNTFYIACS